MFGWLMQPHGTGRRPQPRVVELTTAQLRHYEELWPTVEFPETVAHWLTADPVTLRTRVHEVSLGRTNRFGDVIRDDIGRWGLRRIDVGAGQPIGELVQRVLDG